MRNETIGGDAPSSAAYEGLEAFVRQKVQGFIQEVLEEEVTALLGRRRWQRRRGVDEGPWLPQRVRQAQEAVTDFGDG